jgi:hypothetical protein
MADMPQEGAPASEGSGVGDAISQVGQALDALAQEAPELGEVAEHFRQVVEKLMGGGAEAAPAGVPGAATAEQGGNPNARPMSMGG